MAVIDSLADAGIFRGNQFACVFVQRDQCRGFRTDDEGVHGDPVTALRPADAVRGAGIQYVSVDQNGATSGIVRTDVELVDGIETPEDIGVVFVQFERWIAVAGDVLRFVRERPVVAIGQAVGVQAEDVAGTADDIDAISVHRGRRADAQILKSVMHLVGQPVRAVWNDQLPEQGPRRFIKALDQSLVMTPAPRVVAKRQRVGTDVDLAAGDGWVSIRGRTQASRPFQVVIHRRIDRTVAGGYLSRLE